VIIIAIRQKKILNIFRINCRSLRVPHYVQLVIVTGVSEELDASFYTLKNGAATSLNP
jgi:hypothetical protein